MKPEEIRKLILYEDNHLLIVNKPGAVLSQPGQSDMPDLFTLCKEYLRITYNKPGNAYLGLIHRLDRDVTGITVFAKTSKAAARLAEQFRTRTVRKIYLALTDGIPNPPEGELTHFLIKEEATRTARRAGAGETGKSAKLRYRVMETGTIRGQKAALVEVELLTGRFHQIRFQLSEIGTPVRGDRKYGSSNKMGSGIALHARRLAFTHPVKKEPLLIECPPPDSWPRFD